MARKRRSQEIDLTASRVYHVVSRCVRALHLLVDDLPAPPEAESGATPAPGSTATTTARSQRKPLTIEQQICEVKSWCLGVLERLVHATAIEVAGLALMDNHIHLLLRVDVERAESWSAAEVVERWLQLHPVRNGAFVPIDTPEGYVEELAADSEWVEQTREKLCSISQFMKEFKQAIAQAVNRRQQVSGALWEGRYKVKAVHDEAQLLTTLCYIDLNPFAAGVCNKPEDGAYTSARARIERTHPSPRKSPASASAQATTTHAAVASLVPNGLSSASRPPRLKSQASPPPPEASSPANSHAALRRAAHWLIPLGGPDAQRARRKGLFAGLSLERYLKLLDHVARLLRPNKRRLPRDAEPITQRLSLTPAALAEGVRELFNDWSRRCPGLVGGGGLRGEDRCREGRTT